MASDEKMVVNEDKVKNAIISELPLIITTFTLPREIEVYIESVTTVFLKHAGQEQLKEHIYYCIQELAVNAKKANTKRVFFMEQGLDLSNPNDYKKGMENFKEDTLGNISHYLQKQQEMGLYIRLIMQIRNNIINVEVRNNVAVTRTELIRIHDRIARAREFKSLEEAFSMVLDDSEGAGLGLVILILMLKKIGLNEDCFDIRSSESETIARLMIPLNQVNVENVSLLSTVIAGNIDSLPPFSENVRQMQRLIADKDADMGEIARQLSMDPALTADLLKIVNSAQYMLIKRVDSIFDAVKMVGMRGIKNLLLSYGTQQIMGDDTEEKKKLWMHSYKTAFYAYNLVKNFKRNHDFLEDVYVCGILHDMGKIVFSSAHPELLDKIRIFCSDRNIPDSTFEDLSTGMNHAEIGALLAEKWNYPENLVAAIRFHHHPSGAPNDYRDLVECVYLAEMFCEYEDGNVVYEQFEEGPLASFGISNKKQLDVLFERFNEGFKKETGQ